jgi:hypothetical protein
MNNLQDPISKRCSILHRNIIKFDAYIFFSSLVLMVAKPWNPDILGKGSDLTPFSEIKTLGSEVRTSSLVFSHGIITHGRSDWDARVIFCCTIGPICTYRLHHKVEFSSGQGLLNEWVWWCKRKSQQEDGSRNVKKSATSNWRGGRRWTGTVTSPGWNMESSTTEWLELAMYCGLFIFLYFQICWVYFRVLRTWSLDAEYTNVTLWNQIKIRLGALMLCTESPTSVDEICFQS